MTPSPIPNPADPLAALPGSRVVEPSPHELVEWVARDLSWTAHKRVREAGVFHLALPGSDAILPLYRSLMIDPRYRLFPWKETHLWLTDERNTDPNDDRSTFGNIHGLLVLHSDIPPQNAHPITSLDNIGAAQYEQLLRSKTSHPAVGGRLDYILLTLGSDELPASLCSPTAHDQHPDRGYVAIEPQPAHPQDRRVTITPNLIRSARRLVLFATGAAHHPQLLRLATLQTGTLPTPQPNPDSDDPQWVWCLDHPAATGITLNS